MPHRGRGPQRGPGEGLGLRLFGDGVCLGARAHAPGRVHGPAERGGGSRRRSKRFVVSVARRPRKNRRPLQGPRRRLLCGVGRGPGLCPEPRPVPHHVPEGAPAGSGGRPAGAEAKRGTAAGDARPAGVGVFRARRGGLQDLFGLLAPLRSRGLRRSDRGSGDGERGRGRQHRRVRGDRRRLWRLVPSAHGGRRGRRSGRRRRAPPLRAGALAPARPDDRAHGQAGGGHRGGGPGVRDGGPRGDEGERERERDGRNEERERER